MICPKTPAAILEIGKWVVSLGSSGDCEVRPISVPRIPFSNIQTHTNLKVGDRSRQTRVLLRIVRPIVPIQTSLSLQPKFRSRW